MLPCNITIRELEKGAIEIAVIDPFVAMSTIGNKELESAAKEVQEKLMNVLDNI